jgi:hypothetical protein
MEIFGSAIGMVGGLAILSSFFEAPKSQVEYFQQHDVQFVRRDDFFDRTGRVVRGLDRILDRCHSVSWIGDQKPQARISVQAQTIDPLQAEYVK